MTVAVAGGHAYVAWVVGTGTHYTGLALRRSNDDGASFSPKQTISTAALYGDPSLAAGGATMLLLYGLAGGAVKLARSTNGGATVTQSQVVGAATFRFPGDVAIVGSKARLTSNIAGAVSVRESADGGATWGAPDEASTGPTAWRVNVALAGTRTVVVHQASTSFFDANLWARRSS